VQRALPSRRAQPIPPSDIRQYQQEQQILEGSCTGELRVSLVLLP